MNTLVANSSKLWNRLVERSFFAIDNTAWSCSIENLKGFEEFFRFSLSLEKLEPNLKKKYLASVYDLLISEIWFCKELPSVITFAMLVNESKSAPESRLVNRPVQVALEDNVEYDRGIIFCKLGAVFFLLKVNEPDFVNRLVREVYFDSVL